MIKSLKSLLRCEDGTATIEAIIVLPVAISLMAGGVEFGRILSAFTTADKSMHGAARYLARVPQDAVCGWGRDNAKNLAVYGNVAGTGSPLVPGWTAGTVTLTLPDCSAALPDPLILQLSSAVPFSVNMLSAIGFSNTFTLNVRHQERHIGE